MITQGTSFPSQATCGAGGRLVGAKHLAEFISHLPEMTEMKKRFLVHFQT